MTYKEEIGDRLLKFAIKNYGSKAGLARKLGMKPQSLDDYFSGKTTPGNQLKTKLEDAGLNIVYLLLGKYPNELQAEMKERETEEDKILRNLKLLGLDTWEKINEILTPTLRVAEKMEEYKTKRKG